MKNRKRKMFFVHGLPRIMSYSGFTLIELLVVVLIIGILSAVALPQYQKAVLRARSTEALIACRILADAQRQYYLANGEYAQDLESLDITVAEGKDFRFWTTHFAIFAGYRKDEAFFFEFSFLNGSTAQWCAAPNGNVLYNSMCMLYGTVDHTHPSGSTNYYLIN